MAAAGAGAVGEALVHLGPGWAALGAVVAALALARAARLAVRDEISRPARQWVLRGLDADNPWHLQLAYLLDCVWCASVWLGAAGAAAIWFWGTEPLLWAVLSTLAGSQVAGMLDAVNVFLTGRGDRNPDSD